MKISDMCKLLDPEAPVTIRYYGADPADKPLYCGKPENLGQYWKKGIEEINKREIVTVSGGVSGDTSVTVYVAHTHQPGKAASALKDKVIGALELGLGGDRPLGDPPIRLKRQFEDALIADLGLGETIHYDSPEAEHAKQYVIVGFGLDRIVVYLTTSRKDMLFTAHNMAAANKLRSYAIRSNTVVCDTAGITEIVYKLGA